MPSDCSRLWKLLWRALVHACNVRLRSNSYAAPSLPCVVQIWHYCQYFISNTADYREHCHMAFTAAISATCMARMHPLIAHIRGAQ